MDFMMMECRYAKVKKSFKYFSFLECSHQCLNCAGSKDNCTFCFTNPGYFRDNIPPACNCIDGYFDDGIQIMCQCNNNIIC